MVFGGHRTDQFSHWLIVGRTSADTILSAKLVDRSDTKFLGTPPKRESLSFYFILENTGDYLRLLRERWLNLVGKAWKLVDIVWLKSLGACSWVLRLVFYIQSSTYIWSPFRSWPSLLQSFNLQYKKNILVDRIKKGSKVLDYGCGAGEFVKYIENDF